MDGTGDIHAGRIGAVRQMRRTLSLVALVLATAAQAAHGFDPQWDLTADRRLGPRDPARLGIEEAWRLDREGPWAGNLLPLDRGEASRMLRGAALGEPPGTTFSSPAVASALAWLPTDSLSTEPGLRLALDLEGLLFGADPSLQLHPAFLDVRDGDAVDPATRLRLGLWADARLLPRLSAHLRFVVDSEGKNDPHNRTRDFSTLDASNNLDQAYVRYRSESLELVFGRTFLNWGPERYGSLILSPLAPAPDLLLAQLMVAKLRLSAFAGQLSSGSAFQPVFGEDPDGDPIGGFDAGLRRYIYGHRLDVPIGRHFRLGVSETAIGASTAGGLDFRFVNPLSFYAAVQSEDDGNDKERVNVFDAVDADVWLSGLHLYGSLVVDDLQLDSNQRAIYPDQTAWAAGFDARFSPGSLLGYEYRRLGSWAYLHRGDGVDYENFGRPLGAPEGPDMDRHLLRFQYRIGPQWRFWIDLERRRRGINRIWTTESREGHAGEDFPRGINEERGIARLGTEWQLSPWCRAVVRGGVHDIQNVNNQTGVNHTVWEIRAAVTVQAPPLVIR